MSDERRGYLYGLAAYVLWGFFPIYFKHLQPASPPEILAHRVIWSVVFVSLILLAMRNWRFLGRLARSPKLLGGITLAALLIAVNWGTYIYGVNSSRVVETALGYFITPLVVVLLGVTVLGERLRTLQWIAVGVGTVAVVVLTIDYGRLPYIALILAASFGTYSLVKKRMSLPPAEGLFVESSVLALPALAYVAWLTTAGDAHFGHVSTTHTLLMIFSGLATALPLLLFAGAANRVPMVGIGILQYVAPIIQLAVGLLIYHEPMPPARLAGFALVWVALIVFTIDAIRRRGHTESRRSRKESSREESSREKSGRAERTTADPTAATVEPAATLPPR